MAIQRNALTGVVTRDRIRVCVYIYIYICVYIYIYILLLLLVLVVVVDVVVVVVVEIGDGPSRFYLRGFESTGCCSPRRGRGDVQEAPPPGLSI